MARQTSHMRGENFSYRVTDAKFRAWADEMTSHLSPEKQEMVLTGVMLKLLERLMVHGTGYGTPVDTGRARAGWAAGLNGCGGAYTSAGNDWAMEEQGKKEGKFRSGNSPQKGYAFVQVYNAVPYIIYLELGHSDQAPAGMVRINMEIIRKDLRGAELGEVREAMESANAVARAQALEWVNE